MSDEVRKKKPNRSGSNNGDGREKKGQHRLCQDFLPDSQNLIANDGTWISGEYAAFSLQIAMELFRQDEINGPDRKKQQKSGSQDC